MSITLDDLCGKKKEESTSSNTGNVSNAPLYQGAACYFLALLSFLCMKENSKKDFQHAREGKGRRGWGVGVCKRMQ